jgi:ABC-type bacteriocin/lantibiotic exporter with double-glycine peptidase domain
LQRRVFTKAAFEFAYRLPRLKYDTVNKYYAPELVNRFFDVLTIQKGLPKFLIEFSGAAIQIMFGLLLLSLYHPSFVFFGVVLLGVLFLIFYLLGPRGLKTSIMESKYKYQVIHWLEDIGRCIHGFKLTGSTNLPIRKTDYFVNNYLKNRKNHFNILLTQFTYIILFKALTIGGLLIIGTNLVVAREITLGQFVASEVIIILILNSVEKIIMYTDVVYDLLTAVDKIGIVTDLPLEKRGGIDMVATDIKRAFSISLKNLSYTHAGKSEKALNNLTLNIDGGEKICLAGASGSGKSTLINVITGLLPEYKGSASVNGYSLRDLDLTFYRDHLSANGSSEEVFDGSWLENISLGNPAVNIDSVMRAIKLTGLTEEINKLSQGLDTRIVSSGLGLSSSTIQRLLLARCLAHPARLVIVHDQFAFLSRKEKLKILSELFQLNSTVIFVSNDSEVMASCDQVALLDEGSIKAMDTYRILLTKGLLEDYTNSK